MNRKLLFTLAFVMSVFTFSIGTSTSIDIISCNNDEIVIEEFFVDLKDEESITNAQLYSITNESLELDEGSFICGQASTSRSMYVDNFDSIIGDTTAENALLCYAQLHEIETLLLYGIHVVHNTYDITNLATNGILAEFISKAKTKYHILSIGAIAESGYYFTNVIDVYNNSRSNASEVFDIYNLEFEYWQPSSLDIAIYYCNNYLIPNGLPCTNNGAFQFFLSSLQTIKSLAIASPLAITTEAYVGWPTAGQADTIGANLDRLHLHAYRNDPNTAFGYAQSRLINFANGTTPGLDVSIIFSSEPVFMQTWLENNSMVSAENIFEEDFFEGSSGWSNNVNLQGFTYFTYSYMTSVPLEVYPIYNLVENLSIDSDTIIYADSTIELNNVIVNAPFELTLKSPEVLISQNCEVMQGAKVTVLETRCNQE